MAGRSAFGAFPAPFRGQFHRLITNLHLRKWAQIEFPSAQSWGVSSLRRATINWTSDASSWRQQKLLSCGTLYILSITRRRSAWAIALYELSRGSWAPSVSHLIRAKNKVWRTMNAKRPHVIPLGAAVPQNSTPTPGSVPFILPLHFSPPSPSARTRQHIQLWAFCLGRA